MAKLKDKRVFITGATGFVGQHVINQGIELGVEIHALSRTVHKSTVIQWWQGDVADEHTISRVISEVKPEAIVHLAVAGVAYGLASNSSMLSTNIIGLMTLLDSVKQAKIEPHIVVGGSGFEYGPQNHPLHEDDPIVPWSVHSISKAAATQLATLYAKLFPITLLRMFSLYGPGEQEPRIVPYVIGQAKRQLPIELTAGEQLRDYTYVIDAAEGIWRALESSPTDAKLQIFNLASGVPITLRELINTLAMILTDYNLTPEVKWGARPYRPDELMYYVANVQAFRKHFDWLPSTPLQIGMRQTVESLS